MQYPEPGVTVLHPTPEKGEALKQKSLSSRQSSIMAAVDFRVAFWAFESCSNYAE